MRGVGRLTGATWPVVRRGRVSHCAPGRKGLALLLVASLTGTTAGSCVQDAFYIDVCQLLSRRGQCSVGARMRQLSGRLARSAGRARGRRAQCGDEPRTSQTSPRSRRAAPGNGQRRAGGGGDEGAAFKCQFNFGGTSTSSLAQRHKFVFAGTRRSNIANSFRRVVHVGVPPGSFATGARRTQDPGILIAHHTQVAKLPSPRHAVETGHEEAS